MSDVIGLCVSGFQGKTFTVYISKNATVDQLYNKVFEKLSGNMSDDADVDVLRLYCADRELLCGKGQKVSDCHLLNGSTITICLRVKGGSARLTPIPGQISVTYRLPDMISLDNSSSEPRAIMPCGHVISPSSMEQYCRSKVQDGRYRFPCPDSNCKQIWEFFLVRHVACLDNQTRSTIEKKVTENYISQGLGHQQCPGCMTWCTPLNPGDVRLRCPACSKTTPYDFCWACQREWNSTDLKYCGNEGCDGKDPRINILRIAAENPITIVNPITTRDVQGCPSIRACPKCGLLINHMGGCSHMSCTGCGAEFCFICLTRWSNNSHLLSPVCKIAPVQEVLSDPSWEDRVYDDVRPTPAPRPPPAAPRRATNDGGCVIL